MNQPTHHKSKLLLFVHLVKQSIRGDEHDYTKGSIRQAIILLAIPMILELSLESVFALVDMFFVGRLGDVAVATVGLTESVIAIVYSVAIGLSTAAAAMVSRRTGEKNHDEAAHAGAQAIILSTLVTVLISTAGVIYAPEILRAMGAQQEVVTQGAIFTRILLGGSIVIVLIFLINGIFRGAGNAAMAMRSLWIASGINIILCPLLIYGIGPIPGLGLKGAAIATTIGRGIGVAYQCYYLARGKGNLTFRRRHFAYDWKMIAALVRVAWPATLQFLIGSGSWIVLARLVAESGGTAASAGYQAAIRNVVFFILPAWGFSNAAATLVGQNLGAKNPERASQSVLLTARYNAIFMSAVMLLFVLFASPIIQFFIIDEDAQRFGRTALRIIGTGYIFYGIGMVMIQALNGAGDTRTPTLINLACFWFFQIPLAYLLVKGAGWGPTGAFVSIPIAETAIAITAWVIFKRGRWKKVAI